MPSGSALLRREFEKCRNQDCCQTKTVSEGKNIFADLFALPISCELSQVKRRDLENDDMLAKQ